mmetsp:Transcript_59313/g.142321  ORF Transcript_59313/g.142321 Transcript_59313/m.142321 type:complete len:239 (+) Transcript_59313:339-1055(+)
MATLMLSRLPSSRQWSMSASHTAPMSQGRAGGGGAAAGSSSAGAGTGGRPFWSKSVTLLTTCCDDITSQMPSHAKMTNSSAAVRSKALISGKAVTACRSAGCVSHRLYTKSPTARATARSPFTRPNLTSPPAARMRSFSGASSGLWSSDSATASPPLQRTARESPVLEQMTCVGERSVITAVEPLWSLPFSTSGSARISASIAMSATSNASLACGSIFVWSAVSLFVRRRCSGKCFAM